MAKLESEDSQYPTWFQIEARDRLEPNTEESWQFYALTLNHGERRLCFETPEIIPESIHSRTESGQEIFEQDGYLLCRKPEDEAARLVKGLEKLACRKRNKVDFELLEPCFSIRLKRQEDSGLQVIVFVDAGNVETGISRWDALGIRFFTNQDKLEQFINELKQDFAC